MRILLATDGSEYSDMAAAQCGDLISGFTESALEQTVVKILTVSDYIVDFDSKEFISEEEFTEQLEQAIYKRCSEILKSAKKLVNYENSDLQVDTDFTIGSAKNLIVTEAEKWRADLIIVGSHGRGFWGRSLLGSVSDAVVHHAPCSVLVVRKDQ